MGRGASHRPHRRSMCLVVSCCKEVGADRIVHANLQLVASSQALQAELDEVERDRVRQEQADLEAKNNIRIWQGGNTPSACFDLVAVTHHKGAQRTPPLGPPVTWDCLTLNPPLVDMARRALKFASRKASFDVVRTQLMDSWERRHVGIKHTSLPTLSVHRVETTCCQSAGMCLHNEHGRAIHDIVLKLEHFLNCRHGVTTKIHLEETYTIPQVRS